MGAEKKSQCSQKIPRKRPVKRESSLFFLERLECSKSELDARGSLAQGVGSQNICTLPGGCYVSRLSAFLEQ